MGFEMERDEVVNSLQQIIQDKTNHIDDLESELNYFRERSEHLERQLDSIKTRIDDVHYTLTNILSGN